MTKIGSKPITQLTAPGNAAEVIDIPTQPFSSGVCKVTAATVDTNVVVKMEYSDDGFTTKIDGETRTITADGTHSLAIVPGYKQGRLVFVSETTLTTATIDAVYELYS
jgi:hypothetical protein